MDRDFDRDISLELEYEILQVIQAAVNELVDEGVLQLVGRTSAGEPVWGSTVAMTMRARLAATVLRNLNFLLLSPAFIVEYAMGALAIILVALSDQPPLLAQVLANGANALHRWRHSHSPFRETIWLTIKP